MSYQDTTFYALLGLMASAGLTQNDVDVQQVGPTGVWTIDEVAGAHVVTSPGATVTTLGAP